MAKSSLIIPESRTAPPTTCITRGLLRRQGKSEIDNNKNLKDPPKLLITNPPLQPKLMSSRTRGASIAKVRQPITLPPKVFPSIDGASKEG